MAITTVLLSTRITPSKGPAVRSLRFSISRAHSSDDIHGSTGVGVGR